MLHSKKKVPVLVLRNISGVWAGSSAFLCLFSAEGHELGGWSKGARQGSCVFLSSVLSHLSSFCSFIGSVDEYPWQPGYSWPSPPIPHHHPFLSVLCVPDARCETTAAELR